VCLVVYFNALFGAFVCDDLQLLDNPKIIKYDYKEVSSVLNTVNYKIAKNNPFVYHLTNVILHTITCVLLFYFLRLFFPILPSLIGSCLFAVLPIHTENVTWIAGRAHLLIGLFFLAIFLLFYYKKYLLGLLIFTFLSMSKNMWVGFIPIGVLAYLLTYHRFKEIKWLSLYFAVFLIFFFSNFSYVAERVAIMITGTHIARLNPFRTIPFATLNYLWLMVFPKNLVIYHDPSIITNRFTIFGWVILILVLSILPHLYKTAKPLFFGVLLFFIFLIPCFSFIPIGWLIAERYTYTASISLSILLAWLLTIKITPSNCIIVNGKYQFSRVKAITNKSLLPICLFILALYAVRTIDRNADYKTEGRFWKSAVDVSPLSPQARNNLAIAYAKENNILMALREFKNAVRIKPDYDDAKGNLKIVQRTIQNGVKFNY